jgi:hypothetical protein
MSRRWSFGDEPTPEAPFAPGRAYCHHCGAAAPAGVPDAHARCAQCHFHLHTCANCMFDHGTGCLLLSPQRWHPSGVHGLDCPDFVWRDDAVAAKLDAQTVAQRRRGQHKPGPDR